MQLIPDHTIAEAAASEEDLDVSLLQKLLTRHESGLTVLAAPTQPEGRDRITTTLVRRVMPTLRRDFDFVVIDSAPGFDEQVLGAFDETDECIIVATLDVPTVKNTRMAIETLDLLGLVPGNRRLVINRADEEVGLNLANVEEILGTKVATSMPSALAVANSTNHGHPIVLSKPDHPLAKAISGVARGVAGESATAKSPEPVKRGLFGARSGARSDAMSSLSRRRAALTAELRRRGHPGRPGVGTAPRRLPARRTRRRESRRRSASTRRCRVPREPRCNAGSGATSTRLDRRLLGPRKAWARPAPTLRGLCHPAKHTDGAKDRFDDLKESVHTELLQQLGPQLYDANLDAEELATKVRVVLADVLAANNRPLTRVDRERITQDIADDILGYGPLEPYLRDVDVAEVMVNGPFDIWLERKGRLDKVDGKFKDEAHLRRTIDKIVSRIGRRVDESSPMVDARLPDGSRVNAVVPPLAIDGSTLTIRKFSADPLTVNDLIKFGSLSERTADFLDACVRGRLNVVVSGGTGAGKTTTLNVLSSFIPSDERIVTIEDAAELQLKQDHVVRLESRPANIEGKGAVTIRDLVRNSLRMRPDRIVVGEVRDASALDMLQAMNTGHDGSICTVHSNGPRDTCSRLETLVLMAGMDLPMRAIREQVASAVDLIVHQARSRTAPAASPTSPRSSGWRATSSRCRTSSCSTTPPASTPRDAPWARSRPPACGRSSWRRCSTTT